MSGAAKRDQVGTQYILLQNGKYLEFCVQYYFSLSCKILPIELFIDGKKLTIFIRIKAELKHTQRLKYTPGSSAE